MISSTPSISSRLWCPRSAPLTGGARNGRRPPINVQALIGMKNVLMDPNGVLKGWDINSVDPCSWAIVTCSEDNHVTALKAPSSNLSGMLSQSIGNLTNLETIQLQNNNLTGPIPTEIGKLAMLQYMIVGNPMICSANAEQDCYGIAPVQRSYNLRSSESTLPQARSRRHKCVTALGFTISCVIFLFL